ncbi:MAG: DUF922 domain-containing protein [Litoreibacter sp.]|nr:DUF922 domain-containing protein [Litoreibacter sp.]
MIIALPVGAYDLKDEADLVEEDIRYVHYDISGVTLAEIEVSLNTLGPTDMDGTRRWSDTEIAVNANSCERVRFEAKVTLPRLDSIWRRKLSLEDRLVYERMHTALLNHEMRHVDAARQHTEVMKVLGCKDIPRKLLDQFETEAAQINERSDHGRRNGVNLDPNWAGPLGDLPRDDDLITEDVVYHSYKVGCRNLTDVLIGMRQDGPHGYWGYTRARTFKKKASCHMRLLAEITLPELSETAQNKFSRVERLEFLRMYTALHSHELRHVDTSRRVAEQQALLACPVLEHPLFQYIKQVDERLDKRSKNGRMQGLRLDVEVSDTWRSWWQRLVGM